MKKRIVIDGHNLIPKIPGINLSDENDEQKLLELVQEYCRLAGKQAELFFDGAPTSENRIRKSGSVSPHYVKKGYTADNAIVDWLRKAGKEAKNLTVVSSDHRVQTESRALGAEIMTSDAFAIEIRRELSSPKATQAIKEKKLSESEIDEWMERFEKGIR